MVLTEEKKAKSQVSIRREQKELSSVPFLGTSSEVFIRTELVPERSELVPKA